VRSQSAPSGRCSSDYRERGGAAVGLAPFKIALDHRHLTGDMGDAQHQLAAQLYKCEDVAVRIEGADFGYGNIRQIFRPLRLAQQILRLEDRGRSKILFGQDLVVGLAYRARRS
jgi:hypothetical protein